VKKKSLVDYRNHNQNECEWNSGLSRDPGNDDRSQLDKDILTHPDRQRLIILWQQPALAAKTRSEVRQLRSSRQTQPSHDPYSKVLLCSEVECQGWNDEHFVSRDAFEQTSSEGRSEGNRGRLQ
jgi:hypothetical protein